MESCSCRASIAELRAVAADPYLPARPPGVAGRRTPPHPSGTRRASEPMQPDELPRIAGLTDVFLRLEGATLSIALDPTDLDPMLADWQAEVEAHPDADPRTFTRRFLYEGMLLNRHRDPETSTDLLLAALWLTVSADPAGPARDMLRRGDCGFFTEISVEDEGRTYRVRSWVEDYGVEEAG